jgi:hypothetical protein
MAAPLSPPSYFFLVGGVWIYASYLFIYSYALEVFVEICVRAMPLKFTEDNHDMRCSSHT